MTCVLCTKCTSADIGDEFRSSADIGDKFHNFCFSCPFLLLAESGGKNLSQFYCKNANVNQFHSLFCSKKKRSLINSAHFLKLITSEF